jgi:chromatin segregation and condensation protein Rec8/ScpA/Scc1 (kleisin family)
VAAYFLALLELARWGLVSVSQEDWLSEIVVSDRGDRGTGFSSEWAS